MLNTVASSKIRLGSKPRFNIFLSTALTLNPSAAYFYDDIDDALIEGLEQNQDFFTLLLNNEEIKRSVLGIFSGEIYTSLRGLDS